MKRFAYWFLAFVITVSAMIYQRRTGPTHPKRTTLEVNDQIYKLKLPRSGDDDEDKQISLHIPDETVQAQLIYKRYPTDDPLDTLLFTREGENLIAYIPTQPPAGKIEYFITFNKGVASIKPENPVYIRFKGVVPDWVLIPHIIVMILAMLFSNAAGIMALFNNVGFRKNTFWALGFLIFGGLFLGPIVQWYAFGDLWTGVPFGWDLTDNKTLVAFIFWLIAAITNYKQPQRLTTLLAAIVMIIIYSIPHSALGSELDYDSGNVVTGAILNLLF